MLAPALVTYGWLHYKKHAVKQEIKWRILSRTDKEELIKLTFTAAEKETLRWEHDSEFEYQGRMYDIVESEEKKGFVTYWCFNDKAETELNRQILALAECFFNQDEQKNDQRQRVINFYTNLFNQPVQSYQFAAFGLYAKKSTNYLCSFSPGFLNQVFHPPA